MVCYKNSGPDEYLAITGAQIKNIKITKSSIIWPFQRWTKFSIQPRDYPIALQAMTKEKLQLQIPVVFTIGPDVTNRGVQKNGVSENPEDALMKYCMLLADGGHHKNSQGHLNHIDNIITGIIEGETRVLVSAMTMEEIFTEREQFKKRISTNVQGELDNFGLKIYNANFRELSDAPDSNYFASLSRKAHEGATNQARVDVAEAQFHGNVGEEERRGRQDREIAKIHAETAVQKTKRDTERAKAEAELATNQAAFDRDVAIVKIEAERATQSKDEDLKKIVEIKRAQTELERLRASDVVKASIQRESKQQAAQAKAFEVEAAANADAFQEKKAADARAYKTQTDAEATAKQAQLAADADFYREQKIADAKAYSIRTKAEANYLVASKESAASALRVTKEAEGLLAMASAYSALSTAFGGPSGLIQYMMITKNTYGDLARANADAVRGMQPKMTIWNTGSGGSGDEGGKVQGQGGQARDAAAAVRNAYQMLPPLMTTIHEQTGITLPEWQFGKLGAKVKEMEVDVESASDASS